MADLNSLLAELGGDSPQNRAIAEGLQKQGINSTKDIQVQKVAVPGYSFGSDESAGYVPDTTRNVYFNKATGQEINPTRLGIIQNGQSGVKDGDIFFHLNADDQGNIKFEPEWSPRAHGFLRDNPIGQLIMKAGAIIPNPFQPAFVAANVGDALAHEKYGKALLAALPYGAQELGVTDALKGALGFGGPSGLDMGDVIPQGGIAEFAPDQINQLLDNRLNYPDVSFDNPMSMPTAVTGAVDNIPLDAIKQTSNFVNATGPVDGSPLDVSEADQAFQKLFNPTDSQIQINNLTAQDMATAGTNPQDAINKAAGLDINDNQFTAGTPGESGQLPVNWSPEVTLEDIINSKDLSLQDIVGSDWSAGTPTIGMEGNLPADLTNYYNSMNELAPSLTELTNNSLTQPSGELTAKNVIDTSGRLYPNSSADNVYEVADPSKDLMGRSISNDLTLDKIKDLGTAYLSNPAALAGLVGTGLAATGLVNNVINPVKTTDTTGTNTGTTTAPIASMVPVGSTPGLQDLFDYANLYKNSPFLNKQQTTQQQAQQQVQQQTPSFTVSDVFRNLMADAGPQPKIEPNLVGLADLQKQMARK